MKRFESKKLKKKFLTKSIYIFKSKFKTESMLTILFNSGNSVTNRNFIFKLY